MDELQSLIQTIKNIDYRKRKLEEERAALVHQLVMHLKMQQMGFVHHVPGVGYLVKKPGEQITTREIETHMLSWSLNTAWIVFAHRILKEQNSAQRTTDHVG